MKKLVVFALIITTALTSLAAQVSLNGTRISGENYELLAKCFIPDDFIGIAANHVESEEKIFSMDNDFQIVSTLGKNAGILRFLHAVLKRQRDLGLSFENYDLNTEVLRAQRDFYNTVEELNSIASEKFMEQKSYVEYVFADSIDSAEVEIFNEMKDTVSQGFVSVENFTDIPEYTLNEIVADFKDNEITAKNKWVGKQIKLSASIYSIYQLDFNSVFNIESKDRDVVPVMRLNSGNNSFANCFFNNEDVEKLARYKKNRQVSVVGVISQDIARRPALTNCKIVENK